MKCSSCVHWAKLKSMKGICDYYDYGWVTSDRKACKDFTHPKYNRGDQKKISSVTIRDCY